jgi:hypothetical protein
LLTFFVERHRFCRTGNNRARIWLSRLCVAGLVVLLFHVASGVAFPVESLQITEFMAINNETTIDDDDDRSDWIEIHNPTQTAVNLSNWYLTDDATNAAKWPFPNVTLSPNGYLVVFASGKDRRTPGAPLHTNFSLRGEGEYLALIDPDGNRVSEFFPTYPQQKADISYGPGRDPAEETILVDTGAAARALIPTDDSLGSAWTEVGFDDWDWLSGTTGVGYDYGGLVGLDVGAMRYVNETVYIRIPFEMDEVPEFDSLTLRLQYEDGMIAYLNGERIASENAPDWPTWNSGAPSNRDDSEAMSFVDIDVSSALDLLRVGENVLAFRGLNYLLTSSDLLVRPQLVAAIHPEGPELWGYCLSPTPWAANGPTVPGVMDKVRFSVPSKSFSNSFTLELMLPEDAPEGCVIRYTQDGSVPNESSTPYAGEMTITSTVQVRAKAFGPGGIQSPTASESYIGLETDVLSFTSNLPLVVLENFGGGWMPENAFQAAFMAIFESGDKRSSLITGPDLTTRAGIKRRGSSTAGRPKPSLAVEAWNEFDEDRNISPLGLPAESDWILWGPYNFDPALMRNPLMFELSNQVGRYAVRTRFVEVFLNTGGGRLSYSDYWGVYALMEKISRDEDRVDVERLFPDHDRQPGVTGGYILKIDRPDPGDSGFSAAGQTLLYVYPKEIDIERPERDAQEQYIRGFFTEFGNALNSSTYNDPELGYARYVDVDSWIDHHLLNVVAFNLDAFRLSGYMFKKRGGKLEMGPIWDFDRAMGSTDGRDINPWVWRSQTGDRGTDFFNYPWWGRMFGDIDFFQRYIDRYQELRRNSFSVGNIDSVIDSMADELREAQVRDLQKWGQTPRFGGYQGEIDHLKQWFVDRIAFMDSQFVSPPILSSTGGHITPGLTLTMTAPAGMIYYTMDGSDPRLAGGGVSGRALIYNQPIVLSDTVEIVARVQDVNHTSLTGPDNPPLSSQWSGPVKARFSIHPLAASGNLAITEIYYHPLDPTAEELAVNPDFSDEDFEFIELKNVGTTTIDLVGVQFTSGIYFSFTKVGITTLDPGEFVLLVKNWAAFQVRYGLFDNIAGVYSGSLGNGGESLCLTGATGQTIVAFTYDDDWYRLTDGAGFSLVAMDEHAGPGEWDSKNSWRASANMGGSPGQDDPLPEGAAPIVINEALTNTEPPEVDAIELYNPTGDAVDIGGWFLTDDSATPQKFRIPDGTQIPARGYLVFDESDFNSGDVPSAARFALSSTGDEVFLFSADAEGNLTGYLHGFSFGAAEIGTTFGRHVISTGDDHFVAQAVPTLNRVNAGPKVGPVVINEIMYNPPSVGGQERTQYEYLELRNISSEPVSLSHPEFPVYTWRIEGGVDYTFPEGMTVPPGGYVVVVSFDPEGDIWTLAGFFDTYGLDMTAPIFGPYSGNLSNSGEGIRLCKPGDPTDSDDESVPYILVDQVDYSSSAPWPEGARGSGQSLQRLASTGYGNDPLNWQAADPTPAEDNAEGGNLDVDEDGLPNDWESAHGLNPLVSAEDDGASGDPDGDGSTNLQEYLSGTHPRDPASYLAVHSISANATSIVVRFTAVAGRTYTVLYRDALGSGDWSKLKDIPAQEETGPIEVHDPDAGSIASRFYRLATPQVP